MNRFPLRNKSGFGVDVMDLGATITAIYTPDRNGKLIDVALGWGDMTGYYGNSFFLGATVGRVANRITGGRFAINGQIYQLRLNDAPRPNSLHGGFSYGFRPWEMLEYDGRKLVLHLDSPNGDAGYPGKLSINLTFVVTDDNELKLQYSYLADSVTPVNLTNHAYFNLNGETSNNTDNHMIKIHAERYTETDKNLIPTGKLPLLAGSALDLREYTAFSEIYKRNQKGCDDNFILKNACSDKPEIAAEVYSPDTGIKLSCSTTLPGLQFYMSEFSGKEPVSKSGIVYKGGAGFCLETQFWPDAPNHPEFPSIFVEPDKEYFSETVYSFGII